jgi:ATP-binding cassette, subfamily F, member 3
MKEGDYMLEMKLHGVKKFMEAILVVKNITFEAYDGDKVGIVGANGSGKSTILKLIAGIEKMHYYPGYPQTSSPGYDEGLINLPRGATKAYLEQSPVYPEGLKVIDVLNLAFLSWREKLGNICQNSCFIKRALLKKLSTYQVESESG